MTDTPQPPYIMRSDGSIHQGRSVPPQEHVSAGNDMELDWSTSPSVRNWISGYSGGSGYQSLVDFGDAAGCQYSIVPVATTPCNNGWKADHVWFKSWGATPSFSLPEIYTTNGHQALQWANLAKFSANVHSKMFFKGTMTTYAQDPSTNTPSAGWGQLDYLLNIANDVALVQTPPYSADIRYY